MVVIRITSFIWLPEPEFMHDHVDVFKIVSQGKFILSVWWGIAAT